MVSNLDNYSNRFSFVYTPKIERLQGKGVAEEGRPSFLLAVAD
jgi:hypothetical protein